MMSRFGNEIIETYDRTNGCWKGIEIDRTTGEAIPMHLTWSGYQYDNKKDKEKLVDRYWGDGMSLI